MINTLRPLTQEQRQSAWQAAQAAVIRAAGGRPNREHFSHTTTTKYPPAVTRLIVSLCLILLLAAFTPSAIRLFVIGSQTFSQAVPNSMAVTAVGLATVLSAEVGQVVFSLALATLGTSQSARRLLLGSMGISTTLALVGNIQVALPGHSSSPFAWLEAIAPPLIVLSTAYVLKEQILEAIEQRHINERVYQQALSVWQETAAAPEKHPQWPTFYANALRDALRQANARRQEALSSLTTADWRALVYRELQADHWYQNPGEDQPVLVTQELDPVPFVRRAKANGNGFHALEGAV
jgi:hypothetical protein